MIPRAAGPVSSASIATAVELLVASIANPTELNAVGTAVPDWRLCHTNDAGTDTATLYRLEANTDAVSAPYIMASATAGLRWVAIAGNYQKQGLTAYDGVTTISGNVTSGASVNAASTINSGSTGNGKIGLDSNGATGNFTARLSPPAVLTASRRYTFPDSDGTAPLLSTVNAFTNTLTVVDGNFSILGSSDATKTIKFEVDAQTAADDLTINSGAQTGDRILTVPVLTADATLMTLSETQTVSGDKTFTGVPTASHATQPAWFLLATGSAKSWEWRYRAGITAMAFVEVGVAEWFTITNGTGAVAFGGTLSCGAATITGALQNNTASASGITHEDATTASRVNVFNVTKNTSGTGAAGLGQTINLRLESSTTADTNAAQFATEWVVATHASRTARFTLSAFDTAARECIRAQASGTAAMLGLFGVAAVVQPASAAQAAVATTAATNVAPYGFTTAAQADGIITLLNEIRSALVSLGAIKGSA